VLRFVRDLGDAAVTVLGNHDLHLLAAAHGLRKSSRRDTLDDILAAPDRDELLDWVRHRPILHENPDSAMVMVHAGIAPQWNLDTARDCARELESVLQSDALEPFLAHMYGDKPRRWKSSLKGHDRLRFITNAFTRMRYCSSDGTLDFHEKQPPGQQSNDLVPWFAVPDRGTRGVAVIFGHWATLQVSEPLAPEHGVHHVDTGCVWGGTLSALREDDGVLFNVPGWQSDTDEM
jgi:bis(5'-nucleosyl)-tetraphosphatase (symmetrical)